MGKIDAAIVRIMKTRKVLSHTLLITELFQQVRIPSMEVRPKFLGLFHDVYWANHFVVSAFEKHVVPVALTHLL